MTRLAATVVPVIMVISLVGSMAVTVEPVVEQWTRTFGGPDLDMGLSVQQTSDGGYIMTGYTRSYEAAFEDVLTVKTNSEGREQWVRTYGGPSWDNGYCVRETVDRGYIMTGFTRSYGAGWEDVWLIKTDSAGNLDWDKTFGGAESDWGFCVEQTSDRGYIIAGFTRSYGAGLEDIWLIKTDSNGNQVWDRTFGGPDVDYGLWVQQTLDGGYIVAGRTRSYGAGGVDAWVIKTDSGGSEEWSRTIGGSDGDWIRAVQQTSDGGYVLTGSTRLFGSGSEDLWLVKLDSRGDELWSRVFGGPESDEGLSVQQTSDHGYIVAGWTFSYGAGERDVWLIRTDSDGHELWNTTFGASGWEEGHAVQQTSDGGYIIAGSTHSYGAGETDMWLVKAGSASNNRASAYLLVGISAIGFLAAVVILVLISRKGIRKCRR